jgi:small subunit ribosomal protein S16
VAVKIKLKRMGKIRAPYYRVVVADARSKRDGRAIEEIGKYHPKQEPSLIEIDSDRAQYWLSVGAQPTDPVRHLFKITGDWQKFRGEDGAEGTLKTAAPGPDKKSAFAVALQETRDEAEGAATTAKSRGRRPDTKADKADSAAESAPAKTAKPEAKAARTGAGKTARAGSAKADAVKPAAAAADAVKPAGEPDAEAAAQTEPPAEVTAVAGADAAPEGKAGAKAARKRSPSSDDAAAAEAGSGA